jgi:glycosyltransferase involved in cell wall biosynthesis
VHVAAPYSSSVVPCLNVHVHVVKVPNLWRRNILGHALTVTRCIQTLRKIGPFDLLHAPEYLSTALLTLIWPSCRVVLTEPGNIYERIAHGNPYDFWTTQVFKLCARRTAKHCSAIIATSDEMAYWWNKTGADHSRIFRIPLGVDLKGFSSSAHERDALHWGAEQGPHILFVARLSIETGCQYLIQALPEVLKYFPSARLHILGTGNAKESLQSLTASLEVSNSVTWHGWVPLNDLSAYYSSSDVMVFPGTSGGTPRVVLQAMSCGTPVIGAAIGGITDHIEDGVTGWLVPPSKPADLARRICAVLHDSLTAKTVAGRANEYVQVLSWDAIAQTTLRQVYCHLLLNQRPLIEVETM